MKYLSLCSGIEAATVAWHELGFEPVGFSEVDNFTSAVLQHHYPSVPNLGDMTKYKEWNDDLAFDILVGGTPCQSFSVAGLREGLADPRGNLMLTYCAIAQKYKPKWILWENVSGVLSSGNGNDFRSFLTALAECGYGFAYRVLDAQFFGVPQRRKRVFVVGCFGDWQSAAKVLFEQESLSRNPKQSRKTRKDTSSDTTSSVVANDTEELDAFQFQGFGLFKECNVAGTLTASGGFLSQGGSETVVKPKLDAFRETGFAQYCQTNVAGTLKASGGVLAGGSETFVKPKLDAFSSIGYQGYQDADISSTLTTSRLLSGGSETLVKQIMYENQPNDARIKEVDIAPTITANYGKVSYIPFVQGNAGQAACVSESATHSEVRRLTPIECERLQGFPDNYTQIPYRKKSAEDCPDGQRYKALGNSMAVPVIKWLGERIKKYD